MTPPRGWSQLVDREALAGPVQHGASAVDDRDAARSEHLALVPGEVQDAADLLVDAQDGRLGRQHGAESVEALPAHVAAAGVEILAALFIVPVGDDREVQAERAEEVE